MHGNAALCRLKTAIMRVLIVEDNVRLAGLLAEALGRSGIVCDHATSLDGAEAALDLARFDALLLDLGLPDGDGRTWLQRRRAAGLALPVLVLTARSGLDDRVAGLDAGQMITWSSRPKRQRSPPGCAPCSAVPARAPAR
jgi:DNA-binding response OmpR family regulator